MQNFPTEYNHKITDLIHIQEKFVSSHLCKMFIETFNKFPHLQTKEQSYKYDEKKIVWDNYKCLSLSEHHKKDIVLQNVFNIAVDMVSHGLKNYVEYIRKEICPTFTDMHISQTDNIRILEYAEGTQIKDHSDMTKQIRGALTINLNEDYEGGDFRFFDGRYKVKLSTGDTMFFPAEPIWIHGTEKITKGTRYAINCFLTLSDNKIQQMKEKGFYEI